MARRIAGNLTVGVGRTTPSAAPLALTLACKTVKLPGLRHAVNLPTADPAGLELQFRSAAFIVTSAGEVGRFTYPESGARSARSAGDESLRPIRGPGGSAFPGGAWGSATAADPAGCSPAHVRRQ